MTMNASCLSARTLATWLPAAVFALGAASPAAGRTRHRPNPCSAGTTVARSPDIRVFRKHTLQGTYSYACASGQRRALRLGAFDPDTPAGVDTFVIAGQMLGYHEFSCDHGALCDMRVVVTNVRTRTRIFASTNVEGLIRGLVVAPSGAAAWIRASTLGTGAHVTKFDAAGEQNLDDGLTIDQRSLALGGDHIYWLDDGQPRTATLDRAS
jgi:hypothetical protein